MANVEMDDQGRMDGGHAKGFNDGRWGEKQREDKVLRICKKLKH